VLVVDLLLAANYHFQLGLVRNYPGHTLVFAWAMTVYFAFRHGLLPPSHPQADVEADHAHENGSRNRGQSNAAPPADA